MTFRYLSLATGVTLSLLLGGAASAQQQYGPVSGGLVVAGTPTVSPQNGLLLSDGALLHAGVTAEGGYDSNVFYDDTPGNKYDSSLLRITPFAEITNTARNGEVPSGLYFDARAALTYREYFSSDSNITTLRSFTPSLGATLEHNSNGTLALSIMDSFSRVQDAPYTHAQVSNGMIIRDNNLAAAQLRLAPGGGRLQGVLRLVNIVDYFETAGLKPANSMSNELMLDVSWRWLPKTALYFQVRQGYIYYFNDSADLAAAGGAFALNNMAEKSSSFPLRAMLGLRGLITEKTSVALAVGYQNAFYSNGESTGGFLGSTFAAGELVVMPILQTRITFGAKHEFQNSVIGNFLYDDGAYINASYQTPTRLVGSLWGSYDHKEYRGVPMEPRLDNLVQAGAILDYYLKSWALIGVSYALARNTTDYAPAQGLSGANYTKHQIFARAGITY
jgi:hypothetical protein